MQPPSSGCTNFHPKVPSHLPTHFSVVCPLALRIEAPPFPEHSCASATRRRTCCVPDQSTFELPFYPHPRPSPFESLTVLASPCVVRRILLSVAPLSLMAWADDQRASFPRGPVSHLIDVFHPAFSFSSCPFYPNSYFLIEAPTVLFWAIHPRTFELQIADFDRVVYSLSSFGISGRIKRKGRCLRICLIFPFI